MLEAADWRHLADLKASFPSADYTPSGRTIFNFGGNKFRLAARVDFREREIYIESVMTHEQYDKENF